MTRIQFPDRQPPEKPKPARKRGLRRVSKKRAARMREVTPFRKEYLATHPKCAVFRHLPSVELHELTRGPNRDAALDEPAAVLAVSREGHDKIQNEPLAKQLARKFKSCPREFDLTVINRLLAPRGAADVPQAVTIEDVCFHLEVWL